MSEEFENINPWAEKLEQSSLPDVADQWQSMQGMLDAKIPVEKSRDWRRWLLLIILLLLLIGVCNCPGIMRTNRFSEKNNLSVGDQSADNKRVTAQKENQSSVKTSDSIVMSNGSKINYIDSLNKIQSEAQTNLKKENQQKNSSPQISKPANSIKNRHLSAEKKIAKKKNKILERKNDFTKTADVYLTQNKNLHHKRANKNNVENNLKEEILTINKPSRKKINKKGKNTNAETNAVNNVSEQNQHNNNDSSETIKTSVPIISDSSSKTKKIDSVNEKKTINELPKKKTDSTDKKGKRIALAAGLGINHFFTVGSQQHSDYNSSGTSGVLSDYIPVPILRMYFNKKLYIQLEGQFNTPQYTKKLLASQVIKTDTAGSPIRMINENSIFIKKLFYFNIPLSVHYSPFKNFYIGAGLQFSRLTNGVGSFEGTQYNLTTNDTLKTSKIASFKSDSAYKEIKTNEWRFLFDANYQWKNLVLGVRYNQAFSNFINVQISSTQVTQARNSSIQLYLRYILWKNKKAKELLSK